MFEREITINEFLIGSFNKVIVDIPEETFFQNSVGHEHSPVWILGHLAIVGELGQRLLGGRMSHSDWMRPFGPGSVDKIAPCEEFRKANMTSILTDAYDSLRSLALTANEETVSQAHQVALLEGTPIKTVGDLVTHLLTSHFSFHLAQLSSCRRAAGLSCLY